MNELALLAWLVLYVTANASVLLLVLWADRMAADDDE